MQALDAEDRLFIFLIVSCATYFILATAFVFVEKDRKGFRFAPLLLLLCSVFISFVPEVGFSDVRSHWHGPAAMVPYSLLVLRSGYLAVQVQREIPPCLCIYIMYDRCVVLVSGSHLLSESWNFYHTLLRHN
jgi:hypothetical protein